MVRCLTLTLTKTVTEWDILTSGILSTTFATRWPSVAEGMKKVVVGRAGGEERLERQIPDLTPWCRDGEGLLRFESGRVGQ